MSDDKNNLIEGHDYDGIQEYDNPLPTWWLATFFITIIFGFLYWIHYQFGGGATQYAELHEDMTTVVSLQKQNKGATESEADLHALLGNSEVIAKGHEAFASKCAACHGPQGQGLIGPNLTDNFWIHGQGNMIDILTVVRQGVLDKGMPEWDSLMPKEETQAVTAYIVSLKGTNPPNAKAPQGEPVGH